MKDADIIIIGAGASGLAAARELASAGKLVIVIESQPGAGGRILTFTPPGFSTKIEAGAEFIHGNAPVTESLLKEAGIPRIEMSGTTYRFENDQLIKSEEFVDDIELLLNKMNKLGKDISLQQFMEENFSEKKYEKLYKSLKRLVEGYDAADIEVVSTFSIREELSGGGIEKTFRPASGYSGIIDFLCNEVIKNNGRIDFSTEVQEVQWEQGRVKILCSEGKSYSAEKVLITLSPAALFQKDEETAAIKFSPRITHILDLFRHIGFGTVIKVIIEFTEPFWEKKTKFPVSMPGMDFLLTDTIPVTAWWTQYPDKIPVLTAWMAGPNADKIKEYDDEAFLKIVLSKLSIIYKVNEDVIQQLVKAKHVANWSADKYFRGAYSYSTIYSSEAKKKISQSVEGTIFFAGEALYNGETAGTVEAALANGIETAKRIISQSMNV